MCLKIYEINPMIIYFYGSLKLLTNVRLDAYDVYNVFVHLTIMILKGLDFQNILVRINEINIWVLTKIWNTFKGQVIKNPSDNLEDLHENISSFNLYWGKISSIFIQILLNYNTTKSKLGTLSHFYGQAL